MLTVGVIIIMSGIVGSSVYAGLEHDGSNPLLLEEPAIPADGSVSNELIAHSYGTDADGTNLTYNERQMKPGETVDISEFKAPTWLTVYKDGTYYVKGSSKKTLMLIHAKSTDNIRVIFGDENQGVHMTATKDCPGSAAAARSALTIKGEQGGKITLTSAAGQSCYFRAKGGVPAIRKDSTDTELTFDTTDPDNPGEFYVEADKDATKTSAIGCFSNVKTRNTFGNVIFKNGVIKAYGSGSGAGSGQIYSVYDGGPGIGADLAGKVNGITFQNAKVTAVAGNKTSAAIGTASCLISIDKRYMGIVCDNIRIEGGEITTKHARPVGGDGDGGAGIGGGNGCHSDRILITGGVVTAEATGGAAAIGAGEEGNCNGYDDKHTPAGYDGGDHGVIISGGKVTANGGRTGIGGGYSEGMTDETDRFRFGDCRVVISGGEVTATSNDYGVAIGGWKGEIYDPVMTVTITGGKVNAGTPGKSGGIGAGDFGMMQKIEISGGIVHAYGGTVSEYGSGGSAAIGSEFAASGKNTNSYCREIRITGGTVITESKDKDTPGGIGGYENENSTTWVYISGGNVYADIFKANAHRPEDKAVQVHRNDIALKTYGLSSKYQEFIPVKSLAFSDSSGNAAPVDYGLNDIYTMPVEYGNDPVLHIWLPEDNSVSSAETKDPFLQYGLEKKAEDITEFHGVTPAKTGGTLYPGFWFLFDDNYTAKDTSVSCAHANIGDTRAIDDTFHPIVKTVGSQTISPAGYATDKERKHTLLNADGTFVKDCADEYATWTNNHGQLLITAPDSSGEDPRDLQNHYLNGIKLYSVWDKFALSYSGNQPETASTKISGTMDPSVHQYDETLTLSGCGYSLPGYSFAGWALTADPAEGDKIYQPGDKVNAAEVDPQHTGEICFYARWKPKEYLITFNAGAAGWDPHTQTAVFDEPGVLEKNQWTYTGHTFHGWTAAALGSFYDDGEDFCNLCTLDDDGTPVGITLTADWVGNGSICISVTKDGKGVTGLREKLILIDDNLSEYTPVFTEDPAGRYLFVPGDEGMLHRGWYHLMIRDDDYSVPKEAGHFEYTETEAVSIVLDYYTVTVAKEDEHITSAFVKTSDTSAPQTEAVVLDDTELRLEAEAAEGYHFDSYTAFGVAPKWEPKKAKQTITVQGKADITAHAEANVYHVKFDPNTTTAVKGKMELQDMVYDEPQHLFANRYKRDGAVFVGWNTSADGSGPEYYDGQSVQNLTTEEDKTITLYAQWDLTEYCITYDLTGGKLPGSKTNPDTYTVEDRITLINPEKKDYIFTGWTGTGLSARTKKVTIDKGSTGNRTYKAGWKQKEYKVSFVTNGGNKIKSQTVKIHKKVVQPPNPKRKGYTFAGWYKDKALTKKFSFKTKITGNTTVYAKWKAVRHNVLLAKLTTKGSRTLRLTWTKVSGVDGYDLFFSRCDHNGKIIKCRKIKTIKGNKVRRLNRSLLRKKTAYKAIVKAWIIRDGKKTYVRTSPMVHAYTSGSTKNYTNARSVTLRKTKVTLKKGKTFRIKATVNKLYNKKKLMPTGHAARLRYLSSNKKIAAVSKGGKITARSKGRCKIYVFAANGARKALTVTVR